MHEGHVIVLSFPPLAVESFRLFLLTTQNFSHQVSLFVDRNRNRVKWSHQGGRLGSYGTCHSEWWVNKCNAYHTLRFLVRICFKRSLKIYKARSFSGWLDGFEDLQDKWWNQVFLNALLNDATKSQNEIHDCSQELKIKSL